jgi:uncharacterized protein YuzE
METKGLTVEYDPEGDILHIDTCEPYAEQESDEVGDGVIARFNPTTRDIENLEILFYSMRLLQKKQFKLPIHANLHLLQGA